MSGYWSKSLCSKWGWVTLSANFREWGGMLTNGCWHQKTSPWAIMWHCLPDSAFSRFGTIPANGHMTANTRGSIVLHG